jgi:hypothetical protein
MHFLGLAVRDRAARLSEAFDLQTFSFAVIQSHKPGH